jgi:hypothetical protein
MAMRAFSILFVASALTLALAGRAQATVSIVASDPATGELGVAAASCVQYDLARIATVVPGAGVAVSQGRQRLMDPLRMMRALRSGASAPSALSRVAGPAEGTTDGRQYGVVTADGSVAVRAGSGRPGVSADATGASVAVVGNDLPRRDVVDRAEAAFLRANGSLADRLIAALTASSAAGGDRRCHAQTATAAFIIVTSPDRQAVVPIRGLHGVKHRQAAVLQMVGKTVAADELGDLLRDAATLKRPTGAGRPNLYLSLIQPAHGFNAVELLSQAYHQLKSSPSPTPASTRSPAPATPAQAGTSLGSRIGWTFAWIALGLVALAAWWSPQRRRRDRGGSTTKT